MKKITPKKLKLMEEWWRTPPPTPLFLINQMKKYGLLNYGINTKIFSEEAEIIIKNYLNKFQNERQNK